MIVRVTINFAFSTLTSFSNGSTHTPVSSETVQDERGENFRSALNRIDRVTPKRAMKFLLCTCRQKKSV